MENNGQNPIEIPAPATLGEVAIHLKYQNQLLGIVMTTEKKHHEDNIKAFSDLNKAINNLQDGYYTKKEIDKMNDDHEGRIRALEEQKWRTAGIMSLVVLIVSVGAEFFISYFTK